MAQDCWYGAAGSGLAMTTPLSLNHPKVLLTSQPTSSASAAPAASPPPAPAPHLISASGKRAYPRIAMPLSVRIGGTEFDCLDWSLGGFGLQGAGPAGASGDLMDVALLLRFGHFDATVPVTAKAVRVVDGVALGFRFVDLTTEKAAILNYVADSYLAGDLGSVDGMMEAGGRPGQITFADETVFWMRRARTALRYTLTLTVAVGIIAFSGFSILSTLLTVRSDHAAVSSGVQVVRSPDSGFLDSGPLDSGAPGGQTLTVGSRVRPGEALFHIHPPARPQDSARLQEDLRVIDTRLANQTAALQQAELALQAFHQRTRAELTAAADRLKAANAEVQAQQRIFDRLGRLVASGNLSQTYVDRQEVLLREKQRMVADITAEQVRLQQALHLSEQGLFNSEGRNTQPTPGDIRRTILELEAERRLRQHALAALATPLTVTSPCDCTVQAVAARHGEFIEKGSVVYTFATNTSTNGPGSRTGGQSVEVDVLLPTDKVRLLRVGQQADIRLASAPHDLPGTITRLSFNPESSGRTGLPDRLRLPGRFALATVSLPLASLPAEPLATGLPAVATFRVEAGTLLHYLTGLGWFLPESNAPV